MEFPVSDTQDVEEIVLTSDKEDEAERKRRRRESNKEAAQRCRRRKHEHEESIKKEVQQLTCKQTEIRYEVLKLEREETRLETALTTHNLSCTLKGPPLFRWVQNSLTPQSSETTATTTTAQI